MVQLETLKVKSINIFNEFHMLQNHSTHLYEDANSKLHTKMSRVHMQNLLVIHSPKTPPPYLLSTQPIVRRRRKTTGKTEEKKKKWFTVLMHSPIENFKWNVILPLKGSKWKSSDSQKVDYMTTFLRSITLAKVLAHKNCLILWNHNSIDATSTLLMWLW